MRGWAPRPWPSVTTSARPGCGGSSSIAGNAATRTGTWRPPIIDDHELAQLVQDQPDTTLVELRDRLGVKVTPQAVSKALRLLALSF
jgi:hypothetical protein